MFALAAAATLGLASTVAAGPMRRSSELSIDISAPENVRSLDAMQVTASVTNTGSEPVKVLKAGSVLDNELPTRSFFVSKGDSKVDFSGVKISLAMDKLTEDNYVTIQPGETVNATHDSKSSLSFPIRRSNEDFADDVLQSPLSTTLRAPVPVTSTSSR